MLSVLRLSLKGSWPDGNIHWRTGRTALDTVNGFCKVFWGQAGLCFSMRELQLLFPWSLSGYVFTTSFYLNAISALKNWSSSYASCYRQLHLPVVFHPGTIYKVSPLLQTVLMFDVWCHRSSNNRLANNYFHTYYKNSYLYKWTFSI